MPDSFVVLWSQSLTPQLAEFTRQAFAQGQDGAAVLEAIERITRRLSLEPEAQGESRGFYERVLIEPPLSVYYEVFADAQVVFIIRVHYRAPAR